MFEKIVKWNEERGLIKRAFNHTNEVSFIIEELLESTGNYNSDSARDKALEYAEAITANANPDPLAIVDAMADIIVYATGAIAKTGYNPSQVMDEVYQEISSRTGSLVDGKFVKDPLAKKYSADFSKCKTNR